MRTKMVRLPALWVIVMMPVFAVATEAADAPSPEEEGYHFFVGANLSIPIEDTYFPVERIWNARAHIRVKDEIIAQRVSTIKEINVDRKAKISAHFAQITDLKCEPVYSAGRDPRTLGAQQQLMAESMASSFSDQADSAYRQSANPSAFRAAPNPGLTNQVTGDFDPQVRLQELESMAMNLQSTTDYDAFGTTTERPMWDMLHVQFSIRSETYFPSGHLTFIFQLTDQPEGEPVMSWFHFLSLEDISPETKSYDYRLAAYPDGMYVVSQEAFLYANGSEIATNLSAKHVEMKEKDARVFLKYQYLAENSGKTRPPDRTWKYLDPSIAQKITPIIQDQSITLKIDAEGIVQDIVTTNDLRSVLTPQGIQEIASLIYLPALEDGKPVPGELVLRLGDVVLD